jgi:hypothetical protein
MKLLDNVQKWGRISFSSEDIIQSQIYAGFSKQPSQAIQIATQGFIILTNTAIQQVKHKEKLKFCEDWIIF